ncbi:glycosyltransferase family 2 protein [Arthrobacter sp. NPDC057009]|uniref:glycosyltransferase family 2 protein n=1 Tax=Arthrobacter sp. NPDC057009 TaxID=3345996 RepID=UPI00363475CD
MKTLEHHPTITVVIATCGRPELLRRAVRSILAQDYAGAVEVIVVFDGIDIDPLGDLPSRYFRPSRPLRILRTLRNARTPGLAGGRNTGILAARGECVAFCDDDDEWCPAKLSRQMGLWAAHPEAVALATGITIRTRTDSHDRIPPAAVHMADFLESRVTAVHPSSLVYRRAHLLEGHTGLVDENLPASYGEDYDLLLRATRHGPVLSVLEPLVIVHWDRASFFSGRWENIAAGLTYLLAKFPEFEGTSRGTARIAGQISFAHAAAGNTKEAVTWAWRAWSRDVRQLRAYAAVLVGLRLVPASLMLSVVERRGRGL